MPRDALKQSLNELREEIDQVTNAATRENLDALVGELEAHLSEPSKEQGHSVSGALKGLIEQYEVEYPKVTSILNQMMTSLSNMGI